MRNIQLLLPIISVISVEATSRSALASPNYATREDIEQIVDEMKRFRKSTSDHHKSRKIVYVVEGGSHSRLRSSSYGSSGLGSTSFGTTGRSNTVEIVIKGPPSTDAFRHSDLNCYPNCVQNPAPSSCYPYCNYAVQQPYKPQTPEVPCASCGSSKHHYQHNIASSPSVPVANERVIYASRPKEKRSMGTQTDLSLPIAQLLETNRVAVAEHGSCTTSGCGSAHGQSTATSTVV
jgi:hypothetical protein